MSDTIAQLLTYAFSAWRRRGIAVAIAWMVALAGWAAVSLIPDTFKSQATVSLTTSSVLDPLLGDLTVDLNQGAEITLVQKTLLKRSNVERVLRDTDLDLSVKNQADTERLIQDVTSRVKVSQQASVLGLNTDLFVIGFEDSNPQLAHDVVQSFLAIFVENSLERNRGDMDSARRFIEDQIVVYEAKLQEAELRIAEFYKRNLGNLPEGGGNQSLIDIQDSLSELEANLSDERQRSRSLNAELKATSQFFASDSLSTGGPPTDTSFQILEAQKTVADLLARYTDKHPDVVIEQRRLETLFGLQEKEIEAATQAMEYQPEQTSGVSNPVYEQIKLEAVRQETSISALRNRIAETRIAEEEARAIADRAPELQAVLGRLNLDYQILSSSYEELRNSRQTEEISRAREEQTQPIKFRVVEQPIVPTLPTGPNRPLFLAAVLIISLGSGIGFVVLLALSSETFSTISELRSVLGVPVLGSVSVATMRGGNALARGKSTLFWTVTFTLFATFAALWFVEARIGLNEIVMGDILSRLPGGLL